MRVVITGAASGIGRATAVRLADRSAAELLLVDVNLEGLELVAQEVVDSGGLAATLVVDLSDSMSGDAVAAAAMTSLGGVDALVSNAGVMTTGSLDELAVEEYERSFSVNTRAAWLLSKALFPALRDSRGAIVATASLSGHEPTATLGAYSAGKAALMMLVRQMAYEWGPFGIRANSVSPGLIQTPMTDSVYANKDRAAARASRVPLRRIGAPDDVAAVIAFLLSDDAGYVSGVDVIVDGGLRTTLMQLVRDAS